MDVMSQRGYEKTALEPISYRHPVMSNKSKAKYSLNFN